MSEACRRAETSHPLDEGCVDTTRRWSQAYIGRDPRYCLAAFPVLPSRSSAAFLAESRMCE